MSIFKNWFRRRNNKELKRSDDLQAMYEMDRMMAQIEADIFNDMEQARYEAEVAAQERYNAENSRLLAELNEQYPNEPYANIARLYMMGYGPRVSHVMPPAKKIVI
jgi:glutathione S-transferase